MLKTKTLLHKKDDAGLMLMGEELVHETQQNKICAAKLAKAKNKLQVQNDDADQRKAERTKMVNDLVQRNKDLEQFSYIVSHNLRAPVANILGLVDIIQTQDITRKDSAKATSYLGIAARNLDNVIKDLNLILDLTHTFNEKREIILFDELLQQVKQSLGNGTNSKTVSITGDFAAMKGMVTLKSYLYSIFVHLIRNSIKYKRTGVKPVIHINSAVLDDKILISFKDNGVGIDLEQYGKQVFGLYNRFHHNIDGKGMGLYMVKTQVEALGGKITIESKVNEGTTFNILFDFS